MQLVEVDYIPEMLEPNKFYFSTIFNTGNHLCGCGCGEEIPIPIKPGEWSITNKNPLSVSPSFQIRENCKSHYFIKNGEIEMLNKPIPQHEWDKP